MTQPVDWFALDVATGNLVNLGPHPDLNHATAHAEALRLQALWIVDPDKAERWRTALGPQVDFDELTDQVQAVMLWHDEAPIEELEAVERAIEWNFPRHDLRCAYDTLAAAATHYTEKETTA